LRDARLANRCAGTLEGKPLVGFPFFYENRIASAQTGTISKRYAAGRPLGAARADGICTWMISFLTAYTTRSRIE